MTSADTCSVIMVTQSGFAHRVEKLSDIELAVLSCLVAGQHCIIESDLESQQALSEELQLVRTRGSHCLLLFLTGSKIASNCFGLSVVIVQCSSVTTWEDFGDAILVNDELARHPSTSRSVGVSLVRILLLSRLNVKFLGAATEGF